MSKSRFTKTARIHARDKYCDSRTATNVYPPDKATTCTALLIHLDVLSGTDVSCDNGGLDWRYVTQVLK